MGHLASHAVGLAQHATQNLERLNRHQLANAFGLHLMAGALGNHLAAFHHHVSVGQLFCKVVVLLAQQHSHALALQAHIRQFANHSANVFDDAGLNALSGLVKISSLGLAANARAMASCCC